MDHLAVQLQQVQADLRKAGVRFALVGGLAVSTRTEPRFTRDIDLAVAVNSDRDAEALIHTLLACGYQSMAQVEQQTTGRLATVRLQRAGDPIVDLLFASSGIESEIVAAAEDIELIPGLTLPVARVEHLLALKVLSAVAQRPQDQADLIAMFQAADRTELAAARAALLLIAQRGCDRNQDLQAKFDAFLGSLPDEAPPA